MRELKLTLDRRYPKADYTIGNLYVDGVFFCNTLEDTVRDKNKNGKFDNGETKIKGETAIPYGRYEVVMNVQSPKFKVYKQYAFCNGYLPRLKNVPSFEGVLIHIGNNKSHTDGCILVGENKVKGGLINSTATFKKLYAKLTKAVADGRKIYIEIK